MCTCMCVCTYVYVYVYVHACVCTRITCKLLRLSLVQDSTDEELSGPVKLVVNESLARLLNGKSSLDEFNRDYLTRHKDSLVHLITGQVVLPK